jgi:hypothetical protein
MLDRRVFHVRSRVRGIEGLDGLEDGVVHSLYTLPTLVSRLISRRWEGVCQWN